MLKKLIGAGLTALFVILGIVLVSSCGGGFTITFVDSGRPPAKEPVKQTPPAPVEKEKPSKPVQGPDIKKEKPKTEPTASEEEPASVAGEEQPAPGETGKKTTEPAATEKPAQKEEQPPAAEKPKPKKETPTAAEKQKEKKKEAEPVKEKEKEQKVAKEKVKKTKTDTETKKSEVKEESIAITGIVSLRKNIFYITDPDSKNRYKLVGLKKEEEALLKKLVGKQADFELRVVSTQAKKAYNAQIEKILTDVPQAETEPKTPAPKNNKKSKK